MAIIDTQKELIRKDLILSELKKGVRPNLLMVEELIEEVFKERMAGLPRFEFIEIVPRQVSSSDLYNSLFSKIGQDFVVAFEEVRSLNNKMMSLASYYESNRIRLNRELKELDNKAAGLSIKTDTRTNKDVVGDSMNHFLQVDFKGDRERNIPKTTAFVNLLMGDVEMQRKRNGTVKQDLSEASVLFKVEGQHELINLSPFESALKDTIHDGWRSIVVTKKPSEVKAAMTIELKEAAFVSNVTLDMQAGKPCYTTLSISKDGVEFVQLERMKIISSYQWVFESREIKAIRFDMMKKEEDRPNGSDYEYIFGAKQIQLTESLYEDQSHFVSKPFDLLNHEAVKQISLEAEDYIPPNSSIRYYVGFDYGESMVEWQEIQKGGSIKTKMVKQQEMEINKYTAGYGELAFERFGQKYHRVARLPHKPLRGSIGLMVGRNMWLRETIPAPFTYEPTGDESDAIVYPTGVHDWVRTPSPRKDYVRVQVGFDYLKANRFHRYTTYVFCEKTESFSATVRGTEDSSYAVFLNSNQIKGVQDKFGLTMIPGWNKIEVYAYARDINQEITLDFYIPRILNQIFASSVPMKEVSVYDLINNTSSRMYEYFAVDDDNSIIVNYDPRRADVMGDYTTNTTANRDAALSDGVEYSLLYDYSVSPHHDHRIRFMATMTKEQARIKVSPRLRSYQLIIE